MNQLKRVVHVCNGLNGGVGAVVRELSAYQADNFADIDVAVCSPNSAKHKGVLGSANLIESRSRVIPGGNMLFGTPLRKTVGLDAESTVVHFHNLAGMGCLSRVPRNSICTLHGVGTLVNMSSFQMMLVKSAFRKKVVFTSVDEVTADYFRRIAGADIRVIPNGLTDLPIASTAKHVGMQVGFVGVLDELKGYRHLLKAAKIVCEATANVDFEFVGSCSDEEMQYFSTFCGENHLAERIRYSGEVKDAGVTRIPFFDILVLPSRTEGLPMVLLEALRAGRPILATRVGGVPDILREGFNGYFIERNPADIASKILYLRENYETMQKFGRNSRFLFEEKYRLSRIAALYEELYLEALDSSCD